MNEVTASILFVVIYTVVALVFVVVLAVVGKGKKNRGYWYGYNSTPDNSDWYGDE